MEAKARCSLDQTLSSSEKSSSSMAVINISTATEVSELSNLILGDKPASVGISPKGPLMAHSRERIEDFL